LFYSSVPALPAEAATVAIFK